jgi:hypothetical protein
MNAVTQIVHRQKKPSFWFFLWFAIALAGALFGLSLGLITLANEAFVPAIMGAVIGFMVGFFYAGIVATPVVLLAVTVFWAIGIKWSRVFPAVLPGAQLESFLRCRSRLQTMSHFVPWALEL